MKLSVNFFLGWPEYFAACEFFRRERYRIAPEFLVSGLLLLLGVILFASGQFQVLATVSCLIGVLIIVSARSYRRWASKRRWEREPLYHTEHTVAASEEGVYFLMGRIESNLNWLYYQRLLESPDGFLLVYGNDSFNFLPKRAFASEEMMGEFRALVSKKLRRP